MYFAVAIDLVMESINCSLEGKSFQLCFLTLCKWICDPGNSKYRSIIEDLYQEIDPALIEIEISGLKEVSFCCSFLFVVNSCLVHTKCIVQWMENF